MPKSLISTLKNYYQKSQSKQDKAVMVRGAASSFSIKVIGTGLAFITQLLTARFLGAKDYGNYVYVIAFMELVAILGKIGFDTASMRFLAAYNGQKDWGLLKGFILYSQRWVIGASLLVAFLFALGAWLFQTSLEPGLLTVFWVASLMIPLFTLLRLQESRLLAFKKVIPAQFPQNVLRPLIILLGLGITVVFNLKLNTTGYMVIVLVATTAIVISTSFSWLKAIPPEISTVKPIFNKQEWWQVSQATILFSSLNMALAHSDKLMIGTLVGATDTGFYGVAKRVSSLMIFPLMAVHSVLAPRIADLYAKQSRQELQHLVSFSVSIIFVLTTAIAIGLIITGKFILGLFGAEFTSSYHLLLILLVGELVNGLSGPVALLLNMTGHHNDTTKVMTMSVVVNLLLNAILIPRFGAEGAAIATAVSLIIGNVVMDIVVWCRLQIMPIAVPWYFLQKKNKY